MPDSPQNPFEESLPLHGRQDDTPQQPVPRPPSGFSGMDWLRPDDSQQAAANRVIESGRAPSSGTGRPRRGAGRVVATAVILAATLGLVVSAIVVALVWARGGSHQPSRARAAPPPAPSAAAVTTAAAATPGCVDRDAGPVVSGTGSGGPDSGPDAILWFQHSYYIERSAQRAREMVAADATVTPAEEIQRGIDSVPYGTRYCVRITTVGDNRFRVELTEQRPATATTTFVEIVTTALEADGRTMITGIAAG